jgi:5'-3' exonuclease
MSADRADGELRLFTLPDEVPAPATAAAQPAPARRKQGGRARRRPSPLLLVVDGTGLAHRVFHAVGGTEAPEARPVERFLGVLCRLATDARATACVVGFDDPDRSLRRDVEPAYKAQRPPKPDELIDFLDRIPALLTELGLAVVIPSGLEADDVLGSAADVAERHRVAATLATGDRDAFALVRPTVSVWFLGNGGSVERVSPSWLTARYGVKPAAYLDFAALRGDTSDNLPGVRGIGAMTAARLLATYPSVEAALADRQGLARLLGPALTHTLVDGRSVFLHNRELMRVRTDIPIDLDACNQALDRRTITTVLRDAGLAELTDRVLRSFSLLGSAVWRCPPPVRNGSAATLGVTTVASAVNAVADGIPALEPLPAADRSGQLPAGLVGDGVTPSLANGAAGPPAGSQPASDSGSSGGPANATEPGDTAPAEPVGTGDGTTPAATLGTGATATATDADADAEADTDVAHEGAATEPAVTADGTALESTVARDDVANPASAPGPVPVGVARPIPAGSPLVTAGGEAASPAEPPTAVRRRRARATRVRA